MVEILHQFKTVWIKSKKLISTPTSFCGITENNDVIHWGKVEPTFRIFMSSYGHDFGVETFVRCTKDLQDTLGRTLEKNSILEITDINNVTLDLNSNGRIPLKNWVYGSSIIVRGDDGYIGTIHQDVRSMEIQTCTVEECFMDILSILQFHTVSPINTDKSNKIPQNSSYMKKSS